MFKNLQMMKAFQEINSNIYHWVKVWKKKQIFIFQLLPTEAIGSCFRIAIYLLVGSKIICRNSYKLLQGQTKISDYGLQLSPLMPSHWVSFKSLSKWLQSLQMV
jgi:hypothetical protein